MLNGACEPPGSASISETITICGLPVPQWAKMLVFMPAVPVSTVKPMDSSTPLTNLLLSISCMPSSPK